MKDTLQGQLHALNTAIQNINTITLLTVHVEYLCKAEKHIVKRGTSLCLSAELLKSLNEHDTAKEILSEILAPIEEASTAQNAPKRAETRHES